MLPEPVVALIGEALDEGLLDGPVHPLDPAVGPRMPGLDRAMHRRLQCVEAVVERRVGHPPFGGERLFQVDIHADINNLIRTNLVRFGPTNVLAAPPSDRRRLFGEHRHARAAA